MSGMVASNRESATSGSKLTTLPHYSTFLPYHSNAAKAAPLLERASGMNITLINPCPLDSSSIERPLPRLSDFLGAWAGCLNGHSSKSGSMTAKAQSLNVGRDPSLGWADLLSAYHCCRKGGCY
ncbi:hypothetical protein CVT26_002254 [Gymnopilus dilepis]|uniref:Uncharacterized protein n=1 Tax=Gymnopilus dilepis TaxID=231916 RepID=A0A409YN25_9AGAR|nr:hypothetical protein CVT26_002254 [Gymnopilus dilepis]